MKYIILLFLIILFFIGPISAEESSSPESVEDKYRQFLLKSRKEEKKRKEEMEKKAAEEKEEKIKKEKEESAENELIEKREKSVQKALMLLKGKGKKGEKEKKDKEQKDSSKKAEKDLDATDGKKITDKKTAKSKKKSEEEKLKELETAVKSEEKAVKGEEKKKEKKKEKVAAKNPGVIYIKKLIPERCDPSKSKRTIKPVPVTNIFFKHKGKRGLWIPVGHESGLRKGMRLSVCRDVGNNHFYRVSYVKINSIWNDALFAEPSEVFNPDKDKGSGIREGDIVMFRENVKKIVLRKRKRRKKKPKEVPECSSLCLTPEEDSYDRLLLPEFRDDLLKYEGSFEGDEKKDGSEVEDEQKDKEEKKKDESDIDKKIESPEEKKDKKKEIDEKQDEKTLPEGADKGKKVEI